MSQAPDPGQPNGNDEIIGTIRITAALHTLQSGQVRITIEHEPQNVAPLLLQMLIAGIQQHLGVVTTQEALAATLQHLLAAGQQLAPGLYAPGPVAPNVPGPVPFPGGRRR